MLVLALQVGTAWLMQAEFKAWSVVWAGFKELGLRPGVCTPQQGRMLFTGR